MCKKKKITGRKKQKRRTGMNDDEKKRTGSGFKGHFDYAEK